MSKTQNADAAGTVAGPPKPRVVIIGGGFAGMNLARGLDKAMYDVVLVDRDNFHSFPPLYYQVATSGLDPSSITFPLRREMRKRRCRGVRYHFGTVQSIDTDARTVTTQLESIPYDILVVAAGTTNNFFGIPGLRQGVNTIKSVFESIRTRNDVLERLERAAVTTDPQERRRMLTFTVVGGGPSGVEVAGALGEMKRWVVPREYPSIPREDITIRLVEGSGALLGFLGQKASIKAKAYLESLLVEVVLGRQVSGYDAQSRQLTYADGTSHYSNMVIWTAGISGQPLQWTGAGTQGLPDGRGGRLTVDQFNRLPGLEGVFAVGDIALQTADPRWPGGLPQLAQVAIQQARRLADNLNRGRMATPFSYHDKGTMATVGRKRAIVRMGRLTVTGALAWWMWMVVHLLTLMGMRNRLVVFINWVWAYFSFSSSLRLLLRPSHHPLRFEEEDG